MHYRVFFFLPKPLYEGGPRVCLIRPGVSNPEKHRIYDCVRPGTIVHDLGLVNDDDLVVSGVVEIIDLSNVTMGHFLQFDAMFMKKMALLGGEGSTLRHKGTHFINVPPTFETVYNIFKTFMNEKQKSRVSVQFTEISYNYLFFFVISTKPFQFFILVVCAW